MYRPLFQFGPGIQHILKLFYFLPFDFVLTSSAFLSLSPLRKENIAFVDIDVQTMPLISVALTIVKFNFG